MNDLGYNAGTAHDGICERIVLWNPAGVPQDLGACGRPAALNNANQVVGTLTPYPVGSGYSRAFLWSAQGGFLDLGSLAGTWSRANDINEKGGVVGISWDVVWGETAFVVYNPSKGMRDLSKFTGVPSVEALSINSSGEILARKSDPFFVGACGSFTWKEGIGVRNVKSFNDLGLCHDFGAAINDQGWVAGSDWLVYDDNTAVVWIPGAPAVIGLLNHRCLGPGRARAH